MAINVTYGPISTALGLAEQSGRAAGRRRQSQEDLAFIDLVGKLQAEADQKYANEIQQALGVQQANAALGLQRDRLQQEAARAAAERDYQDQVLKARIADQIADRALQAEALRAKQDELAAKAQSANQRQAAMQQYVAGLPDSPEKQQAMAYLQATGKLPETVVPQNPRASAAPRLGMDPYVQMLQFELRDLRSKLGVLEREKQAYIQAKGVMIEANDPMMNDINARLAAARQEYEAKFMAARSRMQEVLDSLPASARVAAANAAVGSVADLTPALTAGDVLPPADQTAPPAGYTRVDNAGSRGVLDEANARLFLQMARGDKALARKLAIDAGWIIPQE